MAGNPGYIQLPPDSTGKKLQTWDNTVGGNDVFTEAATPTDSTGTEKATATNPFRVDPTGTTIQPVSASSLPLPSNAAQETGGNLATLAGTVSSGRVNTTDAADGTTGAAVPTIAVLTGGTNPSGNLTPLNTDANGNLVSAELIKTGTFTWTSATSLNTVSNIVSNLPGFANITFGIASGSGLSAGAWSLQGSQDGSTWNNIQCYSVAQGIFVGGAALTISFFNAGLNNYTANVAGFAYLQFKLTTAIIGAGNTIFTWVAIGDAAQAIAVVYPKIIASSAIAQTEPITTLQLNNDLVSSNGALAVTMCAQIAGPGNNTGAMLRTPAIFKTASVPATASGNTAVWTPTTGKKFRLMRFQITGSNISATAATVITIQFQDATTNIPIAFDFLMPAVASVAGGTDVISGWVDLGNGYLSSAANNVLNLNVSATVTGATGAFRVNTAGTEE